MRSLKGEEEDSPMKRDTAVTFVFSFSLLLALMKDEMLDVYSIYLYGHFAHACVRLL